MLTKDDIKILDEKFDEKLKPIHDDIKIIKGDVKKLQKDVSAVIDMSDKGLLGFPEADFA